MRLYKDMVLGRAKAYNAVSLVDFTIKVMEEYYRNYLRDFANWRISVQRLALEKLSHKASYLQSCDQIMIMASLAQTALRNMMWMSLLVAAAIALRQLSLIQGCPYICPFALFITKAWL